jgi:hypothetical protein
VVKEWENGEITEENSAYNVRLEYIGKEVPGVPLVTTNEEATESAMRRLAFGAFEGLFTSEHHINTSTVIGNLKAGEDEYGNPQYSEASHIEMERSTASKIQWDNFGDGDIKEKLPELASHYEFNWPD